MALTGPSTVEGLSGAHPKERIFAAVRAASDRTGIDFDYLIRTAERESSLRPEIKAKTSSATGLFQFLDQTWLGMVKRHGAKHGLGAEAALIQETSPGKFDLADPAKRAEILALRKDPKLSALMAGEYTAESKARLEATIGRPAKTEELYAAHFLGAGGAGRLINTMQSDPSADAAALFPAAAKANRSIFYHDNGEAKTAAELYANLTKLPEVEVPEGPVLRGATDGSSGFEPTYHPQADYTASAVRAMGGPSLRLTPSVLDILQSLDPLSPVKSEPSTTGRERDEEREREVSRFFG